MNPDLFFIDSSVRTPDADVWFALPAGFIPLPLRELAQSEGAQDTADSPQHPLGALMEVMRSPEERRHLATLLAPVGRMFQILACSAVIHCSLGLHRDDDGDGRLLPSLFTLSWRATAWAPRKVTASLVAAGFADARHVESLELSCGPALLVETLVSTQVTADVSQELLQVAVYVPFPSATKLAVLTLSTTAEHHADNYRNLIREVAGMVTFENPLPTD
ncbi:hypothetical protein ABZ864_23285 [Streptomyces sp. NPDC047082]|uniref:hypothetical protein n=1 Tax=Streptomyces sp. NPDC047082 TaxID=3155259 RepID=UPI003401EFD3